MQVCAGEQATACRHAAFLYVGLSSSARDASAAAPLRSRAIRRAADRLHSRTAAAASRGAVACSASVYLQQRKRREGE